MFKPFQVTLLVLIATLFVTTHADAPVTVPPSKFLRFCEQTLIHSGLYRPKTQAMIASTDTNVRVLPGYQIEVRSPVSQRTQIFNYTNRDLNQLLEQKLYPSHALESIRTAGHRVLDMACGEGQVVESLRRKGVNAVGVDIYLGPYQRSKSYFAQASADATPFQNGTFDAVISTQGPISYLATTDRKTVRAILSEAHRVLKKGGVLLISPLWLFDLFPIPQGENPFLWESKVRQFLVQNGVDPERDLKHTALWPLPAGFRIKAAPEKEWFLGSPELDGDGPFYWLELERID